MMNTKPKPRKYRKQDEILLNYFKILKEEGGEIFLTKLAKKNKQNNQQTKKHLDKIKSIQKFKSDDQLPGIQGLKHETTLKIANEKLIETKEIGGTIIIRFVK